MISADDDLLLRIVSIDRERERLGLSMNRVSAEEEVGFMRRRRMAPLSR